ncbi:hypothetical protein GGR52DRAFT_569201 [Hypoxylon sp. FL1284]|nr:hypothetical protein GGR52DRAFT_569201 [Hypoxylon sp. FL1284]
MRLPALPPSLLLGVALQALASAALDNDFSAYPQGSQKCLNDAADATTCSGSTGQEVNKCLCSNQGNFIYNTAECVARSSPNDLNAVYDTMENNCAGTGVTIAVSKDAFLSQAHAATATTSSATPSATATSSPDKDPANDGNQTSKPGSSDSMSTGAKIGVGVGLGFGAVALGLLAWFVWAYSRRRRGRNQENTGPSSPFPRDVELSQQGSVSQLSKPHNEYAQHNQFATAELGPGDRQWAELPTEYYGAAGKGAVEMGGDGIGKHHDEKRASNTPLLSELGAHDAHFQHQHQQEPVELPVELPGENRYVVSPLSAHDQEARGQRIDHGHTGQGTG